uniref:Uncharacterized protein LOC111132830 n=1 Tax=Crassostrea virginica TaxID=6565 RepID=A0A8B8E9Z0_CRAVI|nr:uncharacterized protein LOC111132830 [Crassostrea virginica]
MMWPGCGVHGCFILLTLLCGDAIAAPTLLQRKCPYNQSQWEDRATVVLCQGNDVYHCLRGEDKNSVTELCVERSLVLQGNCPFFTKEGYVHWDPCNDTGCPNSSFVSDQVYQYPYCLGNIQESFKESDEDQSGPEIAAFVHVVPIVLAFVAFLAAVLIAVVCRRICVRHKTDKSALELCSQLITDDDVKNGNSVLRKKNVVYIVGLLGNSVSTVGKQVASLFAEENQMSEKCLNYLDLHVDFTFSDKTVYFIDGWYGLWNDNPCEKSEVGKNLNLIEQESNKGDKIIKFVIGMRSDTKSVLQSNGIVVPHNQTVLLDSTSIQKGSKIDGHLNELKRKCNRNDCPCKKITADNIPSNENIGTHLILKLLDLDHTLWPAIIDEHKGPLVAMKEHFQSLKSRDNCLFAGILYIVLNGLYDENNFKGDTAKQFSIKESDVRHKDLEKYTRRLEPAEGDFEQNHIIAPMWSAKMNGDCRSADSAVVFWHNFLYISAFHACYEVMDKEKMLLNCNMDAIFQLVRPIGQGTFFTVEADINSISLFYEKRIKGSELHDHVKDHPLMTYLREKTENE